MATHSRILACKRQRSLESMGSQRVRHDWVSEYAHTPHYSMYQCWVLSYVRILFLLLLHLPVDGHLGCFHVLAVSNKTAMNINICIYEDIISTSLGYLSLNGITRSHKSGSHSVVSISLIPHGLEPARLLCPWASPGKNTGVGSRSLLQQIFPIPESNWGLLHCRQIIYQLSHHRSPWVTWWFYI